jgi:NADH:ubiquinone oxidoreductase subunit C
VNDLLQAATDDLKSAFGDRVEAVYEDGRGTVVRVALSAVVPALGRLRQLRKAPFDLLTDITAVDWSSWTAEKGLPQPARRFSLYYNLFSTNKRVRLFVEAGLETAQSVPTATAVYASANWAEREVYDMFGIKFAGHPDLRRILLPESFEKFPLLKEFSRYGDDPQDAPQE